MPSGRGGARLFTYSAVALAVLAVGVALFRPGSGGYRVSLLFESASQLVEGNQVKVGGVPVGTVRSIELTDDFRARVEVSIDEGAPPLREGMRARVLFDSLTGIAGRYVSIEQGPPGADEIADGGEVRADRTRGTVDADQLLSALDPETQQDLRNLLRSAPAIFEGRRAKQANEGFRYLSPALGQASGLVAELSEDERALTRIVRGSGDVVAALASRPQDLEQLTANALAATSAVAERSAALDSSLARLPPVLRRTNTTLVNLRGALRDLRPLVRDLRPAAAPLRNTLERLRPVARRGRPVVDSLRRTIRRRGPRNDLLDALRGIPPLAAEAVPAFRSTSRTVADLQPIVTEARPYAPDLVGFADAFGGTAGGYNDADGRYVRISLQASLFSLNDQGSLIPLPTLDGLQGLRTKVLRRCPGAATQRLPDGSNPFFEVPGTCDPADTPR